MLMGAWNALDHTTWTQKLAWIAVTFQNPDTWAHLYHNVVPSVWETLKTFVVSELWHRFFTKLFSGVGALLVDSGIMDTTSSLPSILPKSVHRFLKRSIVRGTQRAIQRSLRRHLTKATVTVYEYTTDAMASHLATYFYNPHDDTDTAPERS